jgi:predicted O-linked N-acetylglucosamine transferase (SPINDLY family)
VIVDPVTVPLDQQPFFTERLVHLPDCYQVNDTRRVIADATPSPAECGLPETGFVFCCFNNPSKISPTIFDLWMRLLRAVPDSILWLLESNALMVSNLRGEAASRGVAPARLVFAPPLPLAEHLARHRHADLMLDTSPYGAHTTMSDALWAGLPAVTCLGDTFAGRVGGSLLRAIGLPDLVTGSLAEYETLALRLASRPQELADIRDRLRRNRMTAPLFDINRFTRHIEAAYTRMFDIWCAGGDPETFAVTPDLSA